MDAKIKELTDIFDDRYVKKKELENYASKDDFIKTIAKQEAMQIEQARTAETVDKMYKVVLEIKENQSAQGVKNDMMATDLELAKKNMARQAWQHLPKILRTTLIVLSIFILLFVFTVMIGDPANQFMQKNGAMVAIVTAIVSYYFARKE